ncbi:MAG: hypothetical protein WC544_03595 [Patescibacteria group bacterium]
MPKKIKPPIKNSIPLTNPARDTGEREAVRKILVEEEQDEKLPVNTAENASADFAALYQAKGRARSEMFTIDRRDPNRKKKVIAWVVVGLLVILGVTLTGFYFFVSRQKQFKGEHVSVTTLVPSSVAAGADNIFSITVQNDEVIDIKNVELTVQFPDSFIFKSSSPDAENDAHNAWALGTIANGKSRTVEFIGQPFGDIGSVQTFTVLVTYTPANFSSEFQKSSTFTVTLSKSAINLNMEIPLKVVSGHASEFRVKFTNSAKEAFDRVRLTVDWPSDVTVTDLNPAPTDQAKRIWDIDQIAAGASYELSFKGTIAGDEGAMREFKVEVGYTDDNGQYHKQAEGSSIVVVANPQLILTLSVNDSVNNATADFGGTLDYVVKYRNDSQSEIKDLALGLQLDSKLVDWNKTINSQNGKEVGGTVTWDGTTVPALQSVKPGDEGEVTLRISIKDPPIPLTSADKNYSIMSTAKAVSTNVVDVEGGSLSVASNSITTKINSRLVLRAEGRYYSDEYIQIGSGPLPPQVGQKTAYSINWYLDNTGNEVQNVSVSTVLPEWVTWEHDTAVTAGTISFDTVTRTVTWSINKLPAQVGQLIPEVSASFSVSVTPASTDVGKLMILTGKSLTTAMDTFTEQELTPSQDIITSDLTADPLATGKGIVIEAVTTNTNTEINANANVNSSSF